MDRPSQEPKKLPDTKPEESFHGEKSGAAERQWPSSEVGSVDSPGTRRVFEDGAHRSLRWGASSRGRALMIEKVWGPYLGGKYESSREKCNKFAFKFNVIGF